jgi:hypothetical protein
MRLPGNVLQPGCLLQEIKLLLSYPGRMAVRPGATLGYAVYGEPPRHE